MKLQKIDFLLYGAAFLSALIAIVLVYGYVESRVSEVENNKEVKTVTIIEKPELSAVVVANRDVYRGESLEVDDLKVLMVPTEGVVAEGVVTDTAEVLGRVTKQDLIAGEWIMQKKLTSDERVNAGIEDILEKGMRAMRLSVTDASGLIGVLQPADHVDVISVFESADGSRMISRTILQNIEVLNIGSDDLNTRRIVNQQTTQNFKRDNGESLVTLNVDTRQAEQLALAMNVGAVHLALRNATDVDLVKTDGVNVKVIERSKRRPPKYKPKQQREVIELMQGGQIQEVYTR